MGNSGKRTKREFSQEQYDILISCSKKKDSIEWYNWRAHNHDSMILLEEADFNGMYLCGIDLSGANLKKASLCKADLWRSNLSGANLSGANLEDAVICETDLTEINFDNANLLNANLSRANLWRGNLNKTNHRNANCREANFWQANLIGADLRKADLSLSELFCADLTDARIDGANLFAARLVSANLNNASLTGVKTWAWNIADWNIKGVKCDYIYNDYQGLEKFPRQRCFDKEEFEKFYTEYPTITLCFKNKIGSIDLVILEGILDRINKENEKELKISIKSIESIGVYPYVRLIIEQGKNEESVRDHLLREIQEVRNNRGLMDEIIHHKSISDRSLFFNSECIVVPENKSAINVIEPK